MLEKMKEELEFKVSNDEADKVEENYEQLHEKVNKGVEDEELGIEEKKKKNAKLE
mgnify:CR=1 FL=1